MSYNPNSGYGQSIASALPLGLNGKVHVVGDSDISNLNMLEQIFKPDSDGDLRFHSSLQEAVDECTANAGDIILVAAGHAESVSSAAAVDVNTAGVRIVGIGNGSDRPSFSMDSATAASFKVSAANVYIENLVFEGDIDELENPVHITAADCTLKDIETKDSTGQATDFIVTTADADRLKIKGWQHRGDTSAGADTAISIVGGDDIEIDHFDIDGNFAVAAIENVSTAAANLRVGAKSSRDNLARNRNSADIIFTAVGTTTGYVNNIFARLADDAANITEALSGDDMQFGNNLYIVNADGERALQWNGSASADSA